MAGPESPAEEGARPGPVHGPPAAPVAAAAEARARPTHHRARGSHSHLADELLAEVGAAPVSLGPGHVHGGHRERVPPPPPLPWASAAEPPRRRFRRARDRGKWSPGAGPANSRGICLLGVRLAGKCSPAQEHYPAVAVWARPALALRVAAAAAPRSLRP